MGKSMKACDAAIAKVAPGYKGWERKNEDRAESPKKAESKEKIKTKKVEGSKDSA